MGIKFLFQNPVVTTIALVSEALFWAKIEGWRGVFRELFSAQRGFLGPANGHFWRNFLTLADKCLSLKVYYSNVRFFML